MGRGGLNSYGHGRRDPVLLVFLLVLSSSVFVAWWIGLPSEIAIGASISIVLFACYQMGRSGLVGSNFELSRRADMVADFVSRTRRQLVICSGNLAHPVFSEREVTEAFRLLDPKCEIIVILDGDDLLDPKSTALRGILEDHHFRGFEEFGVQTVFAFHFRRGHRLSRHFMVSDAVRVRLEFDGVFGWLQRRAEGKLAFYLKGAMRLTRRCLLLVDRLIAKKAVVPFALETAEEKTKSPFV